MEISYGHGYSDLIAESCSKMTVHMHLLSLLFCSTSTLDPHLGQTNIYLTPKVTLHFSFLNISSFVLHCNIASIGVCVQHVSEHSSCKAVDIN